MDKFHRSCLTSKHTISKTLRCALINFFSFDRAKKKDFDFKLTKLQIKIVSWKKSLSIHEDG